MRDYGNLICRVLLFQALLMAFGLGAAQADKIYWINGDMLTINRANLDGSEVETLVTMAEPSVPRSIVLDTVNEKMYWMDVHFGEILRANLDGTEIEIVIRLSEVPQPLNPRGLGIDPILGRIFWSSFFWEFGQPLDTIGTIESSNLDGTDRKIVLQGFFVPFDLTFDFVNQKIYWSTFAIFSIGPDQFSSILRSDPDGSNIETVFEDPRSITDSDLGPGEIAVDPDRGMIYWESLPDTFMRSATIYGFYVRDLPALNFNSTVFDLVVEPRSGDLFWSVFGQGVFSGSPEESAARTTQLPIDIPGITQFALDADFVASSGGGGGCFIATAAYGTPLAEDIDALRGFRDGYLMNNALGAAFADAYYRLSPSIADNVAESRVLAAVVRLAIGALLLLGSAAPEIGGGLVVVLALALEARRERRVGKST